MTSKKIETVDKKKKSKKVSSEVEKDKKDKKEEKEKSPIVKNVLKEKKKKSTKTIESKKDPELDNLKNDIKLSDLVSKFNQIDDGGPSVMDIKSSRYYVGVFPEFIDKSCLCKMSTGSWKIYDYFDHTWSLFAVHENLEDETKTDTSLTLTLDRKTAYAQSYGFVKKDMVEEILEEYQDDLSDPCVEEAFNGILTTDHVFSTGRGEDEMMIYTHKTKGYVDALFITNEQFMEWFTNN